MTPSLESAGTVLFMRQKAPRWVAFAALVALLLLGVEGCGEGDGGAIRLRHLIQVSANDSLSVQGNAGNSVTRVGAFHLIANHEAPSEIQIVDSLGEFAGRFGREGQGPQEFLWIQDLASDASGDLWVLDTGNSRLSRFSRDLHFLEAFPIMLSPPTAMGYGLEPLNNGDLLLLGCLESRANCGVHRWSPEGLRWSAPLDSATGGILYTTAEGPDESIWVANQRSYELWELTPSGEILRAIQLQPAWWTEWQEQRLAPGSAPPKAIEHGGPSGVYSAKARVFDIACTDRHVLVLGGTGDTRWAEARAEGFFDVGKSFDSVVEVLDRSTLEVAATQIVDIPHGVLKRFLSPTLLVAEETHPVFDALSFWELTIRLPVPTCGALVPPTATRSPRTTPRTTSIKPRTMTPPSPTPSRTTTSIRPEAPDLPSPPVPPRARPPGPTCPLASAPPPPRPPASLLNPTAAGLDRE